MRAAALILAMACKGGVLCPDGTSEVDGSCLEADTDTGSGEDTDTGPVEDTDPPDLGDLIVDAQPCTRLPAGDRLDLQAGCADGVCAQTSFGEAARVGGRPESCSPGAYDDWYTCTFRSGVSVTVIDTDASGGVSPPDFVYYVQVAAPWGGADAEGLGTAISPGCFVEVLGTPTFVNLQSVEGEDKPWLSYANWNDIRVTIQDNAGRPQPYQPDGRVDIITVFGPAQ
jgi:hypothetical protein